MAEGGKLILSAGDAEFRIGDHCVRIGAGERFEIHRGQLVFLMGPTGSGKTFLARRLMEPSGNWWKGTPRQRRVGMVFQEPASFSDPYTRVADQLGQARGDGWDAGEYLERRLGIPRELATRHPGELSAGQQQRLLIGIQLLRPLDLLIADEPTSALDLANRHRVIELLVGNASEREPGAILFITHDLLLIRWIRQVWRAAERGRFPAVFYRLERDPKDENLAHLKSGPANVDALLQHELGLGESGSAFRVKRDAGFPDGLSWLEAKPGANRELPLWLPCDRYLVSLYRKLAGKTRDGPSGSRREQLGTMAADLGGAMRRKGITSLRALESGRSGSAIPERMSPLVLDRKFFYGAPGRAAGIDCTGRPIRLASGEIGAVLGESGIGKTTLMKMAARLLPGYREWGWGRLGELYADWRRPIWPRLQVVFQNPEVTTLNPARTLRELIRGLPQREGEVFNRREKCPVLMERLDLRETFLDRKPPELSGGEKYRFGMLLALLHEPEFLILDEPFAAVDEETRERICRLCLDLGEGALFGEGRLPPVGVLIISHQIEIIFKICDRWFLVDRRPGQSYGECAWEGRPVDIFDFLEQGGEGGERRRAGKGTHFQEVFARAFEYPVS